MKNKEIKELLNDIKKRDYEVINREDYNLLLSYIEQLENNRDKAVEFIEEKRKVFEWYDTDLFYLESLLKGGSNE